MRNDIFEATQRLAELCARTECRYCPLYSWGGKCCGLKVVPPEALENPHILWDEQNLQELYNSVLKEQGKEI